MSSLGLLLHPSLRLVLTHILEQYLPSVGRAIIRTLSRSWRDAVVTTGLRVSVTSPEKFSAWLSPRMSSTIYSVPPGLGSLLDYFGLPEADTFEAFHRHSCRHGYCRHAEQFTYKCANLMHAMKKHSAECVRQLQLTHTGQSFHQTRHNDRTQRLAGELPIIRSILGPMSGVSNAPHISSTYRLVHGLPPRAKTADTVHWPHTVNITVRYPAEFILLWDLVRRFCAGTPKISPQAVMDKVNDLPYYLRYTSNATIGSALTKAKKIHSDLTILKLICESGRFSAFSTFLEQYEIDITDPSLQKFLEDAPDHHRENLIARLSKYAVKCLHPRDYADEIEDTVFTEIFLGHPDLTMPINPFQCGRAQLAALLAVGQVLLPAKKCSISAGKLPDVMATIGIISRSARQDEHSRVDYSELLWLIGMLNL